MPTAHRRINVTCDPELSAALDATRPLLAERSDAARVRALALAGARALSAQNPAGEALVARQRMLSRGRLRPARNSDRALPWLYELMAEPVSTRGSEALDWVRGE